MEYMDRAFQGSMSSSMATLALSESHAPRYRVLQYGHTVPFVYAAKASSIRAWAPCYRASFYPRVCSLREERMFRSHDHGKLMSDEAECVQSFVVSLLYYTSSIAIQRRASLRGVRYASGKRTRIFGRTPQQWRAGVPL
jgi:hypothetical protein